MAPLDADGARVNGELQRVTRTGAYNGNPSVTPDGRWVAFSPSRSGMRDLWLKDLSTGKELQLTNTPGAEGRPALAPDGTRVAYAFPEGTSWLLAVDSASPELLCQNCGDARGWFPDGRRLVFNLAPRTDRSAVRVSTWFRETEGDVAASPVRLWPGAHFSGWTMGGVRDGPLAQCPPSDDCSRRRGRCSGLRLDHSDRGHDDGEQA